MADIWLDVRYGFRKLARNPGFALVAMLTLALGIGANTAIFSVVHGVLLRPLPYPEPDELVMVWEENIPRNITENVTSPANFLDWRDRAEAFEDLAAMARTGVVLSDGGGAERVLASVVTPAYFQILRAEAERGRVIAPEEGEPGRDEVVVLGHGLWQRRFGGDPAIVGKTVTVNGSSHTIIGVMPEGFEGIRFKPQTSVFESRWVPPAQLWAPLAFEESDREVTGRSLFVLGRLGPEVTLPGAQAEMREIARRLEEQHEYNAGWTVNVEPLHEAVVGDVRSELLILLGAVAVVLLIACVNVANLLLARATDREREIAVRSALGAGRTRVVRQLLTESTILAVLGGAVGVVLAVWGVDVLVALSPGDLPRLEHVGLSYEVLAFSVALSVLTAILFGLLPALHASRLRLGESLKEGARGSTDAAGRRSRGALVVAEVALAVVLVTGATLIVRSFWAMIRVDPGFRAERVLSAQVSLRGEAYRGSEKRAEFANRLLSQVRAIPGVEAAAATVARPLGGGLAPATSFRPIDRPEPAPGEWPVADIRMVSAGYFRTLGIPLHRGRDFEERDDAEAPPVIIISETVARTYWPDEDPVGNRMIVRMGDETPMEVVGVVGDVRHAELAERPRAKIYMPHAQLNFPWMDLVVRSSLDPQALVSALRAELREVDPGLPLYSVKTMDQVVAESVAEERFNMVLLALFAGLALALAAIGIYGVVAFSVSRRTQEIGIRLALGAERDAVIRAVIKEGMTLALLGLVVGLIAALGLGRLLSGLLYSVSGTDPLAFTAVAVLLALTSLIACALPAWRAARVDPMIALRYE